MSDSSVLARGVVAAPIVGRERPRRVEFVTVVLPCLNEEEGVGPTVQEALRGLALAGVDGEVLVVDNGSTDRSVELAERAGARVIRETRRGYGAAHMAGIRAAHGNVIVMADADGTYDLEGVGRLLRPLEQGYEMVVGSRLLGKVHKDAMPPLHRYVGTPVITRILRLTTGVAVSDSQSGYRAFWRDEVLALGLRGPGMEYASEMLLRAKKAGWGILDVPSDYHPRLGESKLNTFSDGWRHLKMLMIMSPHLFVVFPGAVLALLGLALSTVSLLAPAGIDFGAFHWLPVYLGPMLLILGAQGLILGSLAAARSEVTPEGLRKRLAFLSGPGAVNRLLRNFALVAAVGLAIDLVLFVAWVTGNSGPSLLGLAGLAQALVVIGAGGVAAILAAELAREELWA